MADGNSTRRARGEGRDPEKIRAKRRRNYLKYQERKRAEQRDRNAAIRADPAKLEAARLWRREHKRKLRRAAGARQRDPEAVMNRLAEANARQAYRWWMKHGAPVEWRRLYLAAERRRKYQSDPRYALYHRLKRWMHKHLRNTERGSRKWAEVLGTRPANCTSTSRHSSLMAWAGTTWADGTSTTYGQ